MNKNKIFSMSRAEVHIMKAITQVMIFSTTFELIFISLKLVL